MKKSAIFLSLLLCLLLTGCGGTPSLSFDQNRPWRIFTALTSPCAESMRYRVEIYGGTVNDALLTDPSSSYTVTLTEGRTELSEETALTATVNTVLTVVYRDDIEFADKGLTDVIETSVTFRLDNLSALYSYRKATLADREGKKNKGYEVRADYTQKTASITYPDGTGKTMKLKPSSTVYDNEMLFYLVRSLSTIKNKKSDTFRIANTYESFLKGKYSTYSLGQSTENTVDVEVNKNIYDMVQTKNDAYEKTVDDNTLYYVTCHRTQISLNSSKSGPAFFSYMARGAFSGNGTNMTYKVPVALISYQYDLKGNTSYTQICTLEEYSASGNYLS